MFSSSRSIIDKKNKRNRHSKQLQLVTVNYDSGRLKSNLASSLCIKQNLFLIIKVQNSFGVFHCLDLRVVVLLVEDQGNQTFAQYQLTVGMVNLAGLTASLSN